MGKNQIDKRILDIASKVTAKRAKTVIDHIIKHGSITTEDLKETYGYNHPPRAARDVREQGIPLETFKVEASDGRKIAAYKFGDPDKIEQHKLEGRKVFSKKFTKSLYESHSHKCSLCNGEFSERHLQVDHRVPYQVAGDVVAAEDDMGSFMPLCGTCNKKKDWSCQQCDNWKDGKDKNKCSTCYWAYPEEYTHISGRNVRRVEVLFSEELVDTYEKLNVQASAENMELHDYLLKLLSEK